MLFLFLVLLITWIAIVVWKVKKGKDTDNYLTAFDEYWLLHEERDNPSIINVFMETEKPVDPKLVKDLIRAHLEKFSRFTRVPTPSSFFLFPCTWEPCIYNISNHVFEYDATNMKDDAFHDAMCNIISKPLRRNIPMWEVHIFFGGGGTTKMIWRIHHCIADGTALAKLFMCMTDAWNTKLEVPEKFKSGKKMSLGARVYNDAVFVGLSIYGFLKLMFFGPDSQTPLRTGKWSHRKEALLSKPIPLVTIKAVGKTMGNCTVNDVLAGVISGAIRKYMESYGLNPDRLTVRMIVPVNVRSLHEMVSDKVVVTNKFSLVYKSLPIQMADPVERTRNFHNRMELLKHGAEPIYGTFITFLATALPRSFVRVSQMHYTKRCSAVFTNVPGPATTVKLRDTDIGVKKLLFWAPQAGDLGASISVASYQGEVSINIIADDGYVKDSKRLMELIDEEWDQLSKAFGK